MLLCFSDENILNATLISCRSTTRSRNVVLPVCRANVLNSCMHYCALSSDGGASDSVGSLSLLSLSLAVHGGAHHCQQLYSWKIPVSRRLTSLDLAVCARKVLIYSHNQTSPWIAAAPTKKFRHRLDLSLIVCTKPALAKHFWIVSGSTNTHALPTQYIASNTDMVRSISGPVIVESFAS